MTRDEIAQLNPNAILWDGLDEAIIGMAKRTELAPLVVYGPEGEFQIHLDEEYYDSFEEEDGDSIDRWERPSFDVVAYDTTKILGILMNTMEIDESDLLEGETIEEAKYFMAIEYFEYNINGAFVGENTPIHLIIKSEN